MIKFPWWASNDVTDIGNGDPNKVDPGSAKQDSGWIRERPALQHFNWILNVIGHFVGFNSKTHKVDTEHQALVGQRLMLNNLTASCNVLLPPDPLDGQWVEVEGDGTFTDNIVTVKGGAIDIMVLTDKDCILDIDDTCFKFVFHSNLNMWRINKVAVGGRLI